MAVPTTLGDVGGDDGDFGEEPQNQGDGFREGVAAGLRQVSARGDGEAGAERLQDDRHDVGHQRDDEQRVAELGAAGDRGGPVAGIHVADRDEVAGADESHGAPPHRGVGADGNAAVNIAERCLAAVAAPSHQAVDRACCLVIHVRDIA
jgi:hypothetical protein